MFAVAMASPQAPPAISSHRGVMLFSKSEGVGGAECAVRSPS